MKNLKLLIGVFFWILTLSGTSAARTYEWTSFDVTARLASDGTLNVEERHDVLMSGDWNGGERQFKVSGPQAFVLKGIKRLDPATNSWLPLLKDAVSKKDGFKWDADSYTLRWRSRLPDDPPHDNTPFSYLITYSMANVLRTDGKSYILDHTFLMADRPGPVATLKLHFSHDNDFAPRIPLEETYEAASLEAGMEASLTVPFEYLGNQSVKADPGPLSSLLKDRIEFILLKTTSPWQAIAPPTESNRKLETEASFENLDIKAYLDPYGWLTVTETGRLEWSNEATEIPVRSLQFDMMTQFESLSMRLQESSTKEDTQGGIGQILFWKPKEGVGKKLSANMVISYTVRPVLSEIESGRYSFKVDFSDKEIPIKRITMEMNLAPVWKTSSPMTMTTDDVRNAAVFTQELTYAGNGTPVTFENSFENSATLPADWYRPVPGLTRWMLYPLWLLGLAGIYGLFWLAEKRKGSFGPFLPLETIDRAWMDREVFSKKPEEVGFLWDYRLSKDEMNAILTRWMGEGKISSENITDAYNKPALKLKRLVPFDSMTGHERKLLEAIFFSDRETMDAEYLRKHYGNTGKSPLTILETFLLTEMKLPQKPDKKDLAKKAVAGLLWISGVALFAVVILFVLVDPWSIPWILHGVAGSIIVSLLAYAYIRVMASRNLRTYSTRIIQTGLVHAAVGSVLLALQYWPHGAEWPLFQCILGFFVLAVCLRTEHLRSMKEEISIRIPMMAAREYLQKQLASNAGPIPPEWLSYLIALGLKNDILNFNMAPVTTSSESSLAGHDHLDRTTRSMDNNTGDPFSGGRGGSSGGAGAGGSWDASFDDFVQASSSVTTRSSGSGSSGSSSSSSSGSSSSGGGSSGGW